MQILSAGLDGMAFILWRKLKNDLMVLLVRFTEIGAFFWPLLCIATGGEVRKPFKFSIDMEATLLPPPMKSVSKPKSLRYDEMVC